MGGTSFDVLIARLLAERYQQQLQQLGGGGCGALLEQPRAAATLLVEAARVKEVLSASSVAFVSLEGLPLPPSDTGSDDSCAADGGEVPMEGVLRTNISREPQPQAFHPGDSSLDCREARS